MGGAFVCAALGITPTVRHADYIGSWLEIIREDNRAIVRAASAASKAADYLLAFRPEAAVAANDDHRGKSDRAAVDGRRSEEHTSELQSLMRSSYAVFCLKKKKNKTTKKQKEAYQNQETEHHEQ